MCFSDTGVSVPSCWESGGREAIVLLLAQLKGCCLQPVANDTTTGQMTSVGYPQGIPEKCDLAYVVRPNGQVYATANYGAVWFLLYDPGAGLVPVGTVLPFAGSTIPDGWLLCDGAAVSRSTYARLFQTVTTTYGSGNGSTTFNVPDMRGRTVIGVGQGAGLTNRALNASGGAETHALSVGEMPSHTHDVATRESSGGAAVNTHVEKSKATAVNSTTMATGSQGSGSAHNNMQPWRALNYIIKATP